MRAVLAHPTVVWLIDTDDAADGYGPKMSARNHRVSVNESQHHVIDPAHPRGALNDGVEDRLHVRRRTADDAEHLGSCCLMLQRFGELTPAILRRFG